MAGGAGGVRFSVADLLHYAPRFITGAWHGVLYGTSGGVPVVLDARTGRVHPARPAVAPVLADAYGAVAPDGHGAWEIYPAAG